MKKSRSVLCATVCLPLLLGLYSSPVHAQCTNPDGDAGVIIYNEDYCVLQLCAAGSWVAQGPMLPNCTCSLPNPPIGSVCADGTIYAGQSPDGNVKMYTTRCDGGQSWDGATCTGSRADLTWNGGNTSNYVTTGTGNTVTGEANTGTLDGLDSDSVTGGNQAHQAAQFCADLNMLGHMDWYLPAQQELNVLYSNNGAIGNFDVSGTSYWSSTEVNNTSARRQRFQTGGIFIRPKQDTRFLRCVRR
jgi:hypothetical protein